MKLKSKENISKNEQQLLNCIFRDWKEYSNNDIELNKKMDGYLPKILLIISKENGDLSLNTTQAISRQEFTDNQLHFIREFLLDYIIFLEYL